MNKKIKVSVVGCCLVDRLYNNISFSDPSFAPYFSKRSGDGGLTPGHLVFREEFEEFCEEAFSEVLKKITKGEKPDKINIGGPGIVPLVHVGQMLHSTGIECRFYGCGGKDSDGDLILSVIQQMGLSAENYYQFSGACTPSTIVLSDPGFDKGHGERIFINSIGAAWNFSPDQLNDEFFSSDIVVFGGTALVPQIHDGLTDLLGKAKSKGCITIVNTVYDFRNEKANPGKKWPMGDSDESYKFIDLLITDFEEALRLSGKDSVTDALQFFREQGTGAAIVTNGPDKIVGFTAQGNLFRKINDFEMPVSKAITSDLLKGQKGDTTGCGDNFAGGVIAGLVFQLQSGIAPLDLIDACAWGVVSGGYCCFYIGGTYFEKYPGEKRNLIIPYYRQYKKQIEHGE